MKKLIKAIVRRAANRIQEESGDDIIRSVTERLIYRLGDENLTDRICEVAFHDHIDTDAVMEQIQQNFDYGDFAYHIDMQTLAEEFDEDAIAAGAADHIDYEELAKHVSPVDALAGSIEIESVASSAADKVLSTSHTSAIMDKLIDVAANKLLDRVEAMCEDMTVDDLAE